ncbi:ribonuclease inhibitor-like [Amblyraja radiata]|uniref:ribonuclease inhibitor-like n=1 Tax=Amblyraja radiata TaxID=386614 RepID=UPI0014029522|nr:ribonuclease inhibitor-like [Amblyraja radiata]
MISNCVTDTHWGFTPSPVSLCPSPSLSLISRLNSVDLTDSGAEDLVSALSTNASLTELDLTHNSLTNLCVPALRNLILTLPRLMWIRLGENKFSTTGKKELKSLEEPRPGLRVTV